jgi:HAD superfamily hydrolase (TIGR01458 family)
MGRVRAVLLDIDGVLTVSWQPVPGAVAALQWLRAAGTPVALVTNTTSRTRRSMATALSAAGFPVTTDDILTAPTVAAAYLRDHYPGARCLLLNSGDIGADLIGVTLVEQDADSVDVVVIGGAGPEFSYPAINRAFRCLQDGARLVAMSRALYWRTSDGLQLDSGGFVAALEQAAHTQAEVVGKPAAAFFESAVGGLGVPVTDAVMVGDDIDNDVIAAQRCGLTGVLVRTGKYNARALAATQAGPDHVIDSIADLPALLRRG